MESLETQKVDEENKGNEVTGVSVIKEGDFTRSGLEEVDEAEIFEGDENTLMMAQTYTHEFQCKYLLQRYPFDTQVTLKINSHEQKFQECAIKVGVPSQTAE